MNAPKQTGNGTMYCGPAALSIITGKTVEELGLAGRKGMRENEVKSILFRNGFKTTGIVFKQDSFSRTRHDPYWVDFVHDEIVFMGPTLAKFLRERTPDQRRKTMIITAGNHFVVVELDWLTDNHHTDGIAISDYPHRRRRVRDAMIVERRKK
jgi:hypothetical protein